MGIYNSERIVCKNCGNYYSYGDTSFSGIPDFVERFAKNRPRIICGKCGKDTIEVKNSCFMSFDMTQNDSTSAYIPLCEEIWTLPDRFVKLPDAIWIAPDDLYPEYPVISISVSIEDFARYTSSGEDKIQFNKIALPYRDRGIVFDSFQGTGIWSGYRVDATYSSLTDWDKVGEFNTKINEEMERMKCSWHDAARNLEIDVPPELIEERR